CFVASDDKRFVSCSISLSETFSFPLHSCSLSSANISLGPDSRPPAEWSCLESSIRLGVQRYILHLLRNCRTCEYCGFKDVFHQYVIRLPPWSEDPKG